MHEVELNGQKVCVNALRLYVQDTGGAMKKVIFFTPPWKRLLKRMFLQVFYREVIVWKRLQHPNVVPFLGVPSEMPPFESVCDWMENGEITEYVRKNPDVDRVDLVSGFVSIITTSFERQISQLWDVADGLHYLHSCNVIHGSLKGVSHLILHSQLLSVRC